jgi:hypothetical protein
VKSVRDRINEDHERALRSGKAGGLPTTLPKVPTPRENDNKVWLHKFHVASYIGKNPESFDEDTHH